MESHNFGHVVALTVIEIAGLRKGKPIYNNGIFICKHGYSGAVPDDIDIAIGMSEDALRKIEGRQVVTYGVMHLNGTCQEVFVRRGKVSDDIGKDKTLRERL